MEADDQSQQYEEAGDDSNSALDSDMRARRACPIASPEESAAEANRIPQHRNRGHGKRKLEGATLLKRIEEYAIGEVARAAAPQERNSDDHKPNESASSK